MPPAPPSAPPLAPPSAQPTRLKLKPSRTFRLGPARLLFSSWHLCCTVVSNLPLLFLRLLWCTILYITAYCSAITRVILKEGNAFPTWQYFHSVPYVCVFLNGASKHRELSNVCSQSAKQGLEEKMDTPTSLIKKPLVCFPLFLHGWGEGVHTHLRIEDICYFCNTTVLTSTHIDCTIYSSLYSEIQQGLNFAPCSGMALLAWKNEHSEEKHTYIAALHSTQFALLVFLLVFTFDKSSSTVNRAWS